MNKFPVFNVCYFTSHHQVYPLSQALFHHQWVSLVYPFMRRLTIVNKEDSEDIISCITRLKSWRCDFKAVTTDIDIRRLQDQSARTMLIHVRVTQEHTEWYSSPLQAVRIWSSSSFDPDWLESCVQGVQLVHVCTLKQMISEGKNILMNLFLLPEMY